MVYSADDMSKEGLIGLIGFVLVLLPHLGIPVTLKAYITIGSGSVLLLCSYLLYRERVMAQTDVTDGERSADTFVETTAPLFDTK